MNNNNFLNQPNELIIPEISSKFKENGYSLKKNNDKIYQKNSETWNNILILGENKEIMISLLKKCKEKIDLIYIDPPFFTNSDYYQRIFLDKHYIQKISYNDKWSNNLDLYLSFLKERLALMKELLSDKGSIYLHLDWHVSHHIKLIMDDIFGRENFRNEIIWFYPAASAQTKKFYVRSYDSIFYYTKSDNYIFNDDPNIYMEYSNRVKNALKEDEQGLYYHRGGSHDGKKLKKKVYIENKGVFPRDVWLDIPYIRANTLEYQGFSTQKPERLLKRIILASSKKNSIIADFFCGSGTTIAVAEKLGRKWIGCDLNWDAIIIIWKRLLELSNSNDILNWKKKYNDYTKPFNIFYTENQKKTIMFPEKFINDNKEIKSPLESLPDPSFEIKVKKQNSKINMEISNYLIPYFDLLPSNIKDSIKNWQDFIDSISIDFNYNNNIFRPTWISFKTPKKREIMLTTGEFEYDDSEPFDIMIKIVDIIGFESSRKITITNKNI